MTILDSDILIAILKGRPEAIQKVTKLEDEGDPISTTIITAYELLKGAYLSHSSEETLSKVTDALSDIQVLDLTYNACEEASKIYRDLKKKGRMVGEFDILIAAIARTNGQTLISRDEHFELIMPHQQLAKW
jgi:tRNA(fMet)-specific endonuclease VapC